MRKSEIKKVIRILIATNLYKALPARETFSEVFAWEIYLSS